MTARHILLDRHFLRNGFRGLPPFHRGMRSLLSAMHELQTPIESSRLPIAVAVSGSGCNGDVSVVLTATTPTRAHTHTHTHARARAHTHTHQTMEPTLMPQPRKSQPWPFPSHSPEWPCRLPHLCDNLHCHPSRVLAWKAVLYLSVWLRPRNDKTQRRPPLPRR